MTLFCVQWHSCRRRWAVCEHAYTTASLRRFIATTHRMVKKVCHYQM